MRLRISKVFLILTEFIIFADFWVILAVSLWGRVSYRLIRISGTYFEARSILRPLIIWCIAIGIWMLLKIAFKDRSFTAIFENPYYYLSAVILVYAAIAIPVYLQPYYSFSYGNAHDFAARHHAIYNSIRGNILRSDIFPYLEPFQNWNYLGDNFSIIGLLLVPIYYFFQSGSTLVLCESIALIASSIPVFLIADRKLKNKWASLIVSLMYLFYPFVIRFPFYEFRLEYFAVPFLFFAFYYIHKNKIVPTLIFLALTVLCREVAFIAVAVMGIYVFFHKGIRHRKFIGILLFLGSISVCFFIITYIIPKINHLGFYGYGPLGGRQILTEVFYNPKRLLGYYQPLRWDYFISIFKNTGFVPLLSPMILLSIPFLLQNWLTDIIATTQHIWHSTFIIPFLFISLIYGIANILRVFKKARVLVFIWLISFTLFFGGRQFYADILRPFFVRNMYLDAKPDIYKEFCKAEHILPRDKSVFTQFGLLPNLSNREKIYWRATLPDAGKINTDYLFFSPMLLKAESKDRRIIKEIIAGGRYIEIYRSSNFVIMARRDLYNELISVISDFSSIKLWKVNSSNCDYKYQISKGSLIVNAYFDGDGKEDEFVQIRKIGLNVSLKDYPEFYLRYKLDDTEVQTIEMVFGIDINNDKKTDGYIKGIYTPSSRTDNGWKINVYNMAKNKFPQAKGFSLIELELYPHKIYGVDCRYREKGWYKFNLKQFGFRGVRRRDG